MSSFALFTDVSLNPKSKSGIGAYLLVPISFLELEPHQVEQAEVARLITTRGFSETSSTKLEVQTVLWAIKETLHMLASSAPGSLRIYTDSQCVAGLLQRRARLTANDFVAKRSGKQLVNAGLYGEFYKLYDRFAFQLIKVAGHSPTSTHDTVHRIFSYLDREVRKALIAGIDVPDVSETIRAAPVASALQNRH